MRLVNLIVTGAINWDINLFITRFPDVGVEVPVNTITRVPGGTGANVSVAAARLLNRGEVAFIGSVGTDSIGATQIQLLEAEGIDSSAIKIVEAAESGQAYITIDQNGSNCIYTYFGANLHLVPNDFTHPQRLTLIQQAKVVVIMDPPLPTAETIAELAHASHALVIWDPGVYCAHGLNALARTLANTDYFILNHVEFQNLLGTTEPAQLGETLSEIQSNLKVVIKQGAQGSTLIKERGQQVISIPAVRLERIGLQVRNTVGCGDAFIGSLAASKARGESDEHALKMANYAGAFKATRSETRGSPTQMELDAFIRRAARFTT